MPYIDKELRHSLTSKKRLPQTPGELNFLFTYTITDYLFTKELNYQTINDVIGALTAAKDEFYRRIVVPYEKKKIKDNGDVYE